MIIIAIRWWYRLCSWYAQHVVGSLERKKLLLEFETAHVVHRQRLANSHREERLQLQMRHELQELETRIAHSQEHSKWMRNFSASHQVVKICNDKFEELHCELFQDHKYSHMGRRAAVPRGNKVRIYWTDAHVECEQLTLRDGSRETNEEILPSQ